MVPEFGGLRARVVTEGDLRLSSAVVAIGAFDGVHQGHQALISSAVQAARLQHLPAVVWTFDPPPRVYFGRAEAVCSLADRLARIAALGPDWIVLARFTATYAAQSPEDFLDTLAAAGAKEIHVGTDFRFGARQSGDAALLASRFDVRVRGAVTCPDGEIISSTRIRALREEGNHTGAAELLNVGVGMQLAGLMLIEMKARSIDV